MLTVQQDIADFINWYKKEKLPHDSSEWKFLIIGGSYPGALSSWFRTSHPELVEAAWSSSGVVNAILKFPEFDEAVAEAIGQYCASAVREHINAFVDAIESGNGASAKAKFGLDEGMADPDVSWAKVDPNISNLNHSIFHVYDAVLLYAC